VLFSASPDAKAISPSLSIWLSFRISFFNTVLSAIGLSALFQTLTITFESLWNSCYTILRYTIAAEINFVDSSVELQRLRDASYIHTSLITVSWIIISNDIPSASFC
jgi:hypothetical protein